MPVAQSKGTAQGQTSVPAEVRRRLGIGPGSWLEWDDEGGRIVVRRAGKYDWKDVHDALFPGGAGRARTLAELKEGVRAKVRRQHARH